MTDTPTPRTDNFSDEIDCRIALTGIITCAEIQDALDFARTLERDLTACRAALRELVECKDLHDRIEARDLSDYSVSDAERTQELAEEYDRRKPLAWSAARAILQSTGEGEGK